MDRKFLEGLGVEKEAIDTILNKNGEEVAALKTKLSTKETEVATLRGDLVTANSRIADLEKVDVDDLQGQLEAERTGRAKDKQDFVTRAALEKAGCKDIDYVLFKLGENIEYDEHNNLKDSEAFINSAKEQFGTQFEDESTPGRFAGPTPGATIKTEDKKEEANAALRQAFGRE